MNDPAPFYTHADHAKACAEAAAAKRPLKKKVQVQIEGRTLCAHIKDAFDIGDSEMWKVDIPGYGVHTVPVRMVRQCSMLNDGRCQCDKSRR